jgi:hypothetical protein
MNSPLFIFEDNNNIADIDIARNTTKRRTTLFFILVRKKRRVIIMIKESHPVLENVETQIIIDSTVKIPNAILSLKHTLVINIPKETGIIKFA